MKRDEHRVLPYRPRTSHRPPGPFRGDGAADEFVKLDHVEEPDDFRHRMFTNLAAFAFTVVLVGIGIWLAFMISDLRKTQDCALTGRRNCVPIASTRG